MLTEMPNQEWDIFFPLPERGNVNREYVQSIEQIGAKLCSSTMAIKSLFGRGNQASICAKCAGTAQPFKLPFLQDAQKFWLQINGNFTGFVKKYGSLRCQLKTPYALRDRSGERPFSCPNNSLSSTPVGIAAQFSFANGWFRRWLRL